MTLKSLLYYAALGSTIAIFIGCSIPGKQVPTVFSASDKLTHVFIFAVFGGLWYLNGYKAWRVLLAGIGYGILIEIWQGIMPINRSFDLYDALADSIGTAAGIGVAMLLARWLPIRTA
ncbi:hypothetical protein GCM10027578_08560 [Spirosoma luteolum]